MQRNKQAMIYCTKIWEGVGLPFHSDECTFMDPKGIDRFHKKTKFLLLWIPCTSLGSCSLETLKVIITPRPKNLMQT